VYCHVFQLPSYVIGWPITVDGFVHRPLDTAAALTYSSGAHEYKFVVEADAPVLEDPLASVDVPLETDIEHHAHPALIHRLCDA
jgi:hypothetical protein